MAISMGESTMPTASFSLFQLPRWLRSPRTGALLMTLVLVAPVWASTDDEVARLLAQDEAPFGVVFEIVEGDEAALQQLLPGVRDAIERIRTRFPDTGFAIVSHGREEFALQTENRAEYPVIHEQVQALVSEDVPVHVCATHASWYGITPEDFPDYVDVAPTGPGQVRLYQDLGYELIVVYQ